METPDFLNFLKYKRQTFIPVVNPIDSNEQNNMSSKFGGKPYVSNKFPWPVCYCKTPMQFFLQLNSNQLPEVLSKETIFGDGLLQFFYCTKTDCTCDDIWKPFSKGHCVRIIKMTDLNETCAPSIKSESEIISSQQSDEKLIVSWVEEKDYPSYHEWTDLNLIDLDAEILENEYWVKSGEKLLGWPLWIQDSEYPNCPVCNLQMEFIFQVDSNCNIQFTFGDLGCGHITQCKVHKDQLAFNWACG